jgi:cysteine desulfuration protein SufE
MPLIALSTGPKATLFHTTLPSLFMTPHPSQNEDRLVAHLLQIEDALERLAFVQDRVRKRPALSPEHRSDSNRIHGCATKVWLRTDHTGELCHFEVDSESSIVRGLASLVAEVFSGTTATDAAKFESHVVDRAGLSRIVTPTRLHGLAKLEESIRTFAESIRKT